jgi:uncharacterized protein (TIRG00374 family)
MISWLQRNWKGLLTACLGLLLLWWALRSVIWADVAAAFAQLTWLDLLALALANGLVLVLLTLRWHIFLRVQGVRLSLPRLLNYRLAAFGVSYFTPGPHFGGEPLQVYLPVKRDNAPVDAAVIAVALDKTLELLVNFGFLVAAAIYVLQRGLLSGASGVSVVVYAVLLLALPVALLSAIWAGRHPLSAPLIWWETRRPSPRLATAATRVHHSEEAAAQLCRTQPGAIIAAFVVSLLAWLAMIGEFWLATYVLGIGLTPGEALAALLAMRLAILLPLPAGLGALEASLVMAMELLGAGGAAGLSLALLIRTRDVLLGLLGLALGGFSLLRGVAEDEEWREALPDVLSEPLPDPLPELPADTRPPTS